jgi:hypothetical protein
MYLRILYLYLLLYCLVGCRQGQSTAVLEIYVLDPLGDRVPMANVNLYRLKEDWDKEKNFAKTPETTTVTGLIRFVNLEAGTYYIDVKKDSLNNWEGKVETMVKSVGAFYVNTEFVIVKDSKSSDVASAEGKKWLATTVKQFNTTTTIKDLSLDFRCRLDNVLIFYKSGVYEIEGRGDKCSINETPIEQTGTWKFNDAGTAITLRGNGKEPVTWTVLVSDKHKLVFQEVLVNPFFGLTSSDITYTLFE